MNAQHSSSPGLSSSAVKASVSKVSPQPAALVSEDEASLCGRGVSSSEAKSTRPQRVPASMISAVPSSDPTDECKMVMFDENQTELLLVRLDNATLWLAGACSDASQSSLCNSLNDHSWKWKKDKKKRKKQCLRCASPSSPSGKHARRANSRSVSSGQVKPRASSPLVERSEGP